ncbi:MAG TPA: PAS domain S-box protein, partial [Flavobacteriales bacterium]|nr:PAS domain S-box protein [Flavobacteriales bacterium]
ANFDRDGNPIKLFGIAHDVTEVISVQKDLSKSKERHKELLNNMNDGFVVNDSEGKIIYANQQFLKMFDIIKIDLDKFNWEMVVAPEFIQQFKVRFIRDKHDSPEAGMFEFRCIRKGGESIWIEARVNSVLENGHVSGTQAVLSDINFIIMLFKHRKNFKKLQLNLQTGLMN